MAQKKKKFRFKIPWKSQSLSPKQRSKSPPPTPRAEPEQHPPSRPPQSPTSSVIVDSPVSSPSHSTSPPSSPLRSPTQDLLLSNEASSSHSAAEETTHLAPPSDSQQEHEKMKSPLKVIPSELELEKQSKTHQHDESKDIVVIEHVPVDIKHGASNRKPKPVERKKTMFATSKAVSNPAEPSTRNVPTPENPNPLQKGIKEEISNFVEKVATVNPTHHADDKNISVVTLAGENRGATMNVSPNSSNKGGSIPIHRAYRTDIDEVTTDADEKCSRSSNDQEGEMGKAYVNSNIQSVNNSLMMHGSVSERDPGVRLVLPQKKKEEAIKQQPQRQRQQQPQPQPVVRRRCLRGMLMEPSDSEPDNPDKPRRHGCKFRCGDTSKDLF